MKSRIMEYQLQVSLLLILVNKKLVTQKEFAKIKNKLDKKYKSVL